MQFNRAAVAAVLAIALIVTGLWLFRRSTSAETIDLLATFDTAEKRPNAEKFQLIDSTLRGETKRAIHVEAPGRVIWRLQVPEDGWLRVALGLKEEAWTQEGDGVLFLIGVSDGRQYEPLLTQHVNPFGVEGDRRWIPVMLDLSSFSGEEVELIFNAYNSPEGKGSDPRADLALWGAPEVVVR